MAMIRKLLVAFGVSVGLAAAVVALPSTLSASPKHTTAVKIPAGSTVQKMNNGHFAIRNGLNIVGTYSCRCSDKGSCSTVQTEGVLQCGKDGDSCTGSCEMSTTTGGKVMLRQ